MADLSQQQVNALHDSMKVNPSLRKDPYALQSILQTYGVDSKQLSAALSQQRVENQVHRSLLGGIGNWLGNLWNDTTHLLGGTTTAPIIGMPMHGGLNDPNYDLSKSEYLKMANGAWSVAKPFVAAIARGENPVKLATDPIVQGITHPMDLMLLLPHAWAGLSSDWHRRGGSYVIGEILPMLLGGMGAEAGATELLGGLGARGEAEFAAVRAARIEQQLAEDKQFLEALMRYDVPYKDLPEVQRAAADVAERRVRLHDPLWFDRWMAGEMLGTTSDPLNSLIHIAGDGRVRFNPDPYERLRAGIAEKEAEMTKLLDEHAKRAKESHYSHKAFSDSRVNAVIKAAQSTVGKAVGAGWRSARTLWGAANSTGANVAYFTYLEGLKERDPKAYEAAMQGNIIDEYGNLNTLGAETARLLGQDSGFFHSLIKHTIDFATTFLSHDPYILAGKYIKQGKSAVGFTGALGKYFGGMAIHEAGDATRVYHQYSGFRRAVDFMAHATPAEIAETFRGVFNDNNVTLLNALGKASSAEEVLSIFEDVTLGMQMVGKTLPRLGWYSTFKTALKGSVGQQFRTVGDILQNDVEITDELYQAVKEQTGLDIRPRSWLYTQSPPALKANVLLRQRFYRQFLRTPEWYNIVTRELTNNALVPGSLESVNAFGDMAEAAGMSHITVLAMKDTLIQTIGNRDAFNKAYRNVLHQILSHPLKVAMQGAEYEAIADQLDTFIMEKVDSLIGGDAGSVAAVYGAGRDSFQVILKEGRQVRSAIGDSQLGTLRLPSSREIKQYQRTILNTVTQYRTHESETALREWRSTFKQLSELARFSPNKAKTIVTHLRNVYKSRVEAGDALFESQAVRDGYMPKFEQLLKKYSLALSDRRRLHVSDAEKLASVIEDLQREVRVAQQRYQMNADQITAHLTVTPPSVPVSTLTLEEAAELAGTTEDALMTVAEMLRGEMMAVEDMMAEIKAMINQSPDSLSRIMDISSALSAARGKIGEARKEYARQLTQRWAETTGTDVRFLSRNLRFWGQNGKRGVRSNREMFVDLCAAYLNQVFKPLALATIGWAERVTTSEFMLNMFRYEGKMFEGHLTASIARLEAGLTERLSSTEKSFFRNMFASFVLGIERGMLESMGSAEMSRLAHNAVTLWYRNDGHLPGTVHGTAGTLDSLTEDEIVSVMGIDSSSMPVVTNMRRGKNFTMIQYTDEGSATAFRENLQRVAHDGILGPVAKSLHNYQQEVAMRTMALNEEALMPDILREAARRLENGPNAVAWRARNEAVETLRKQILGMQSFRDASLAEQKVVLDYLESLAKTPDEIVLEDLPRYMQGIYDATCRNIASIEDRLLKNEATIAELEEQVLEYEAILRSNFAADDLSVLNEQISKELDDAERDLRAARSASVILDREIKEHTYRSTYMLLEHGAALRPYREVLQELRQNLADSIQNSLNEAELSLRDLTGLKKLTLPRLSPNDMSPNRLGSFVDSNGNPVPNQEFWDMIFQRYPELWSSPEIYGEHFEVTMPGAISTHLAGTPFMPQDLGADAIAHIGSRDLQALGLQAPRNFQRLPEDLANEMDAVALDESLAQQTVWLSDGRRLMADNLELLGYSADEAAKLEASIKLTNSLARQLDAPIAESTIHDGFILRPFYERSRRIEEHQHSSGKLIGQYGFFDDIHNPLFRRITTGGYGHLTDQEIEDLRHLHVFDSLLGSLARRTMNKDQKAWNTHYINDGRIMGYSDYLTAFEEDVDPDKIFEALQAVRYDIHELDRMNQRIKMLIGTNQLERNRIEKIKTAWDDAYNRYQPTAKTVTPPLTEFFGHFPAARELLAHQQRFFDRGGRVENVNLDFPNPAEQQAFIDKMDELSNKLSQKRTHVIGTQTVAENDLSNLINGGADDYHPGVIHLREVVAKCRRDLASIEAMRNSVGTAEQAAKAGRPTQWVTIGYDSNGEIVGLLDWKLGTDAIYIGYNGSFENSGATQLISAMVEGDANGAARLVSASTPFAIPWHMRQGRIMDSGSVWETSQWDALVNDVTDTQYKNYFGFPEHMVDRSALFPDLSRLSPASARISDSFQMGGIQEGDVEASRMVSSSDPNARANLRYRTFASPLNTQPEIERIGMVIDRENAAQDLAKALDFPIAGSETLVEPNVGLVVYTQIPPREVTVDVDNWVLRLFTESDDWMKTALNESMLSTHQVATARMIHLFDRLVDREVDATGSNYFMFEHVAPQIRSREQIHSLSATGLSFRQIMTRNWDKAFRGRTEWSDDLATAIVQLGLTRDEVEYITSRIQSLSGFGNQSIAWVKIAWKQALGKVDLNALPESNPFSFVPTYGRINTPSEADILRWFDSVSKQANYRHALNSSLQSMLRGEYNEAYKHLMKVDPSTVTQMEPLVDPIAGRSQQSRMFETNGVPPEIVLGANRSKDETLSDLALHLRRQRATKVPALFNSRTPGSYTLGDDASRLQFNEDFKRWKAILRDDTNPEYDKAVEWFTTFIGGEPDSWAAIRSNDVWARQADLMRAREESSAQRDDYLNLLKRRRELGRERSLAGLKKRNALRRAQAMPSVEQLEEAKQVEYDAVLKRLDGLYSKQESLSEDLAGAHNRRVNMEESIIERDARLRENIAKKVVKRSNAHIRAGMKGFGPLVRLLNSRMDTINARLADEADKVMGQVMVEFARKEMSGADAIASMRSYLEQTAYAHLASMPEEKLLAFDRAFYPLAENSTGDPLMDWARAIAEHIIALCTSSVGHKYFPEIAEQMATGRIGSDRMYAKWFSDGIQTGEGRPSNFPAREFLTPGSAGMTSIFVRGSEALHRNVLSKIVNSVIRNPLFVLEYHNQMEHLQEKIINGIYTREQAEVLAEAEALKNMMKYVHDPIGKTVWENNMRIAAPFYFAKNQALRRAIRVAGDDLGAFYKYIRLNLAITNFVAKNQDGSQTYTMPGSEVISGMGVGMAGVLAALTSGDLNQGNLTNAMNFGFDGSPTSVVSMVVTGAKPGAYNMMHEAIAIPFGPLVTFPAKIVNEYIALHNPMVEHVFKLLLGETAMRTSAMDDLVPNTTLRNTIKGIWGFTQQDQVSTYASTEAWVIQDIVQQKFNDFYLDASLMYPSLSSEDMAMYGSREQMWSYYAIREAGKWMNKHRAQLQHEANMRTAVLYAMKIASSFSLPVAVSIGERFTENDQFREILQERDEFGSLKYPTYILAADEFMKRYPTHILDLISHTSYSGARYPETQQAYDFFGQHFNTVATYPNVSAYFIPEGGANFNSEALRVEYALGLRQRQAPTDFIKSVNVMLGNRYYGIMYDKYKAVPGAIGPDGRLTYEAAMRLKSDMFLYGQTINADWMADKNSGKKQAFAYKAYQEMKKFLKDASQKSVISNDDADVYKYLVAQRESFEQSFRDAARQGFPTGKLSSAWYDYCTALSQDVRYEKYASFIRDVMQHLPKPE